MKRVLFLLSVVSSVVLGAAVPELGNVTTNVLGRKITIAYNLSSAPAIVTAQVSLGGTPVPAALLANAPCNRIVRETSNMIRLSMPKDLAVDGELSVKLKAYSLSNPPDYVVFDLGAYGDVVRVPDNRTSVRFYESEADIPGGIHAPVYTTTSLVMRRIPAAGKTWRMGTSKNMNANVLNRCIPRIVTLTRDYYISVFEFTCGQAYNVWGAHRPRDWNAGFERLPLHNVYFSELRGNTKGRLWPALGESEEYAHQVDDSSLIADLRAATGIALMDIPTSAQWEFAYRAGCEANNYWGLDWADDSSLAGSVAVANQYCWSKSSSDGGNHLYEVGQLLPNAWGLYDMSGNQGEVVLDWFTTGSYLSVGESEVDPRGPAEATVLGHPYANPTRTIRGGHAAGAADSCVGTCVSSVYSTQAEGASIAWHAMTFRPTCPVDMSVFQ